MSETHELDIFVNCPFDDDYKPFFYVIVFVVIRSGYRVRCALEADNAADNRLDKIGAIIEQCPFGVHDISRTEADGDPPLPRFNMPFELGLFLGARRFGRGAQKRKSCIVFDREPDRFRRLISDIAGQDIHSHEASLARLIADLAAWLRGQPGGAKTPGGEALSAEYAEFERLLPTFCESRQLRPHELTFGDLNGMITEYVAEKSS